MRPATARNFWEFRPTRQTSILNLVASYSRTHITISHNHWWYHYLTEELLNEYDDTQTTIDGLDHNFPSPPSPSLHIHELL